MRIGVMGCAGRMGRALIAAVNEVEDAELAGGVEIPGHPAIGEALGRGLAIGDDPRGLFETADVVIEFSSPRASLEHAAMAAESGARHVLGTTGFDLDQRAELGRLSQAIPIFWAPNMSIGVALTLELAERLASALGEDWDAEIVEMHHKRKVDAPSGTALALGQVVARGRGAPLEERWVKSRDGQVGARRPGSIGFATLRGGDVVGEHKVIFAGEGERIEIGHIATDRMLFARGAVRAARWLMDQPAGLWGMSDLLARRPS